MGKGVGELFKKKGWVVVPFGKNPKDGEEMVDVTDEGQANLMEWATI